MRYLALDLGDRRTGIAVGDSVTRIVSPVSVLEIPIAPDNGERLLAALVAAAEEHLGPVSPQLASRGQIVVGLPMNMDGTEGPRARLVRDFADRLSARIRRPVRLHDERLTSAAADWSLARSGLTHKQKKERRDAHAAAAMLKDFLDSVSPHPPGSSPPGGEPAAPD
jgi:putative Holliday junction resolvase